MNDISGLVGFNRAGSPAVKLSPVVKSWMKILSTYSQRNPEDALWWYNERATLSSLAGAAWRVNTGSWMAIEEFRSTKLARAPAKIAEDGSDVPSRGRVESGSVSQGRVDLFLTNGKTQFAIEAKQAWQRIGSNAGNHSRHVHDAMRAAWNDAGHLTPDEGDHRLACTFVVPFIAPGVADQVGDVTDIIKAWLDKEVRGLKAHAIAYHFPGCTRHLRSQRRYVFPGVVMLLRERKRSVKKGKLIQR